MKVILSQFYDMFDYDNLQTHEIIGLVKATIKEHFVEEDEA